MTKRYQYSLSAFIAFIFITCLTAAISTTCYRLHLRVDECIVRLRSRGLTIENRQYSDTPIKTNLMNGELATYYSASNNMGESSFYGDISTLCILPKLRLLSLYDTEIECSDSGAWFNEMEEVVLINVKANSYEFINRMPRLKKIFISGSNITAIPSFANGKQLLEFKCNDETLADISYLSSMTSLKVLIMDNSMAQEWKGLSALTNLEYLSLNNTSIDDIAVLVQCPKLAYLSIKNTVVSDESLLHFKQALPQCIIEK